jgi:dihydrofolate reductase
MIIGGGEIYKQALGFSNRMYLTRVSASFAGADTFFPAWNEAFWHLDFEEHHTVDEKHKYAFDFQVLNRKNLS